MWVLYLTSQSGLTRNRIPVARASTKAALQQYVKDNMIWGKRIEYVFIGTLDHFLLTAREAWGRFEELPDAE